MSLVDNIADVSFASEYSIDKIVGVWEGSYNKSSDTSSRGGGFMATIYVYSIPHGFTRPVFTHLLWSEDQTTWVDGGGSLSGGSSAIAFSDSTNIHIATTSNSGTLYYKLIAYWIDDYDSTNPSVPEFSPAASKLTFDSRANYQKIAAQGVTQYSPGTFSSPQTITVNHSLGYIPNAKAFFEPISGEVWPMNAGGQSNVFLYSASQDEAYLQIFNDKLEIEVLRFSNATRNIWYRIYYDA